MKNLFWFMGLLLLLLNTSCAIFGGDMPIRVVGSVPKTDGSSDRKDCVLSLVSAATDRTRTQHEVPSDFSTSFVVEARSTPYYFVAKCKDGREFKSRDVVVGGRGSFNQLIDLGEMDESK